MVCAILCAMDTSNEKDLFTAGRYAEKVDVIEKDVKEIKERMGKMEDAIYYSVLRIPKEGNKIGFSSPLMLKKKGVALYENSGAKEYVE